MESGKPALPLPVWPWRLTRVTSLHDEHAVRACCPCRIFPAPVWQWCKSQLLRLMSERSQVRLLPRTRFRGACSSAVEHLRTVIACSLHEHLSIWPWCRVRLLLGEVGSTPTRP